jgi:6-phosphofructokinase 1
MPVEATPSSSRPLRVCLLTGGGDAPGLNAAVRAFVHAATRQGILVHASRFGFEGLLGRDAIEPLRVEDVRGILQRGGSILGCSTRSNPFALPNAPARAEDAVAALRLRLEQVGIGALVLAGGDGTMGIAATLKRLGVHCVGIPKTIDGDLWGTDRTCGIDSAVETATHAIDALHSTAEAHQRVMIVEVMGRCAGWLALRAGIAGGADAILIPEMPYDPGRVVAKIREREALGLRFSIVVVGEGARPAGQGPGQTAEPAGQGPRQTTELAGGPSEPEGPPPGRLVRLGGAGQRLAEELEARDLGHEVRVTVLGHLQRGGTPTATDRLLGTRFGAHAAELCAQGLFGRMVCSRGDHVDSLPLEEAAGVLARVAPDGALVRCARAVGIELGA